MTRVAVHSASSRRSPSRWRGNGRGAPTLEDELVRPRLLPAVWDRIRAGRGEFLAELRPAYPVFLRFGGIDYDDDDEAIDKLDGFVRRAQQIMAGYGGNVLQLTLGDKGAYLYGVFGSPTAHEDDAARAAAATLELRDLERSSDVTGIQIGIGHGRPVSLTAGTYNITAYFNGSITLLPSSTVVTLSDDVYQNATSATKTYQINPWTFTGFLTPVDNQPTVNTATAGQAIPVKFSLGGNRGLAIFSTGYPKATITTCASGATDAIEEVSTATSSSLQYDAVSGTYNYTWKTDKVTMAGKCVRLDLVLVDGTTHSANFKFK
jgi:hypothetical protein